MFGFYSKKVKKDLVMEIIDKYKDKYNLFITQKPNGSIEVWLGSKKNENE